MDASMLYNISESVTVNKAYQHIVDDIIALATVCAKEGKFCFVLNYANDKYKILKNTHVQKIIMQELRNKHFEVYIETQAFDKGSKRMVLNWQKKQSFSTEKETILQTQKMLIDLQKSIKEACV